MNKQLWDPDKNIEIAKDHEKKQGLFYRKRLESDLDKNMETVFDKLYNLYERSIIDKARVIFGSNLIELRFSNNPFCPKAYTLEEFLALELEHKFDFDICSGINMANIEQSLISMKDLRFKQKEYLEAFRLNSFSGNIWAYFSSSSSLITDHHLFLAYQHLRSEKNISHDKALKKINLLKNYFLGDQEFFNARNTVQRQESQTDSNIDKFIDIALTMFKQNKIFEIQIYLGSGVIRAITPAQPFTAYAFSNIDELNEASHAYFTQPMNMEESLENKDFSRPNLRINRNLVNRVFQIAKKQRLIDENLYLRVFYIDFIYNKVLSSFSCGGTRYQQSEQFIDDYDKVNTPI